MSSMNLNVYYPVSVRHAALRLVFICHGRLASLGRMAIISLLPAINIDLTSLFLPHCGESFANTGVHPTNVLPQIPKISSQSLDWLKVNIVVY